MKSTMLFAGLAACAPVPAADTPVMVDGPCSIQGLNDAVGKPYSADSAEQARIASGAKIVRIIRPGTMVTMDYRTDRLDIELDEKDTVTRLRCG